MTFETDKLFQLQFWYTTTFSSCVDQLKEKVHLGIEFEKKINETLIYHFALECTIKAKRNNDSIV